METSDLDRHFARFAASGDPSALGRVFDRSAPALLRVARRMAPDEASAEDLVQETFVTALGAASAWDPSRPVGPWLIGILANHARVARRKRGRAVEPDRLAERSVEAPDARATEAELASAVRSAVADLPTAERTAVAARLFDGVGAQELAERFGLKASTVRVRMHRGLSRLREQLSGGFAGVAVGLPGGLGAMRVRVLAMAGASGGASSKVAGLGWLPLALAAVLGLVGGGWWMLRDADVPAERKQVDLVARTPDRAADAGLVNDTRSAADERQAIVLDDTSGAVDPEGMLALEFRVVERGSGAPIIDAPLLVAHRENGDWTGPTLRTDAEGRAVLEWTPAVGRLRVDALPTAATGTARRFVRPASLDDPKAPLVLEVDGGGALAGKVVGADGRPIPGAAVSGWCGERIEGHAHRSAVTDTAGRFRLEHLGPEFVVLASKEGYVHRYGLRGTFEAGDVSEGHTIELEPASEVSGEVTDEEGRPLEDVRIASSFGYGEGRMAGDTPDVRVHRLHGRALTAETDASGRFRIHGVPEGGVRLEFTKEHFVAESQHFRPRDPSVDTTFGPEDEFLTDADSEWRARIQRERSGRVVLRRGREVRGRVLTHTGHAAAGAEVTLTPGNAVTEGDPWRTTCDEEGRFVLPGVWRDEEFDSYQLLGLKVLHAGSAVHVEQPLGEGEIDVRLEKGARAQGRILRADGEPLSDAKVRVLGGKEFVPSADWGAPPTWEWGLGVDTARTNDEGYFVLSNLHAGPYVLAIHDPAEERRWIEEPIVAGGPEVEITVGVGAFDKVVLEGRAVDAVTGEPIEEFTLVPMIDGSGSHYAFESRVGEFRLAGLDARPLELSARADGYAPWARELAPERHGVLPVEVRMFPLRTLRFRLVESGGEPTQRTFGVSVEDLEGRTLDLVTGPSSWTNRVRVGPSQPGVLHGLPATRSTLVVNDGLTEQRFAVDLTLPREDELEFTLEEVVPREEGGLVFLVTGPSERAGEELARELERLMTDGDRAGFAAKMAEVLRSAPRLPIELHGECVEHGESFHAEITAGEEMPFAVAVRTSRGTGYGGGAGTAWKQELEFPGVTVDGIVAGTWSVRVSRAGRTLLERTVETVSLDLEPGEMPPLTVLRVQ